MNTVFVPAIRDYERRVAMAHGDAEAEAFRRQLEGLKPGDVWTLEPTDPGTKHDGGKLRTDLLPVDALENIAAVLTHGAQKYGANNWRKGIHWSRYYGAALRHLFAWSKGENTDPETGLPHLAHAGCCVLFLLESQIRGYGTDDRVPQAGGEKSK